MLKDAVLAHFDNSPVAVARAIGLTRSAVNQWNRVIPLDKALRIQAATGGALKVDLSLYEGTVERALVEFGRRSRRHSPAH